MACPRCRHLAESAGPPTAAQDSEGHEGNRNKDRPQQVEQKRDNQEEEEEASLRAQIRELEQDLAQTKLKMVEARCKIQVREGNQSI